MVTLPDRSGGINMVAEDARSGLLAQVIKSLGVRLIARTLLLLQPLQHTSKVQHSTEATRLAVRRTLHRTRPQSS